MTGSPADHNHNLGLGLPSPDTLERFERISPGFIDFLKGELQAHRQAQQDIENAEREATRYKDESERRLAERGQIFAFAIGVIAICAGALTAILHAEIAGGFIGSGGVIGLVTVFIINSKISKDRR